MITESALSSGISSGRVLPINPTASRSMNGCVKPEMDGDDRRDSPPCTIRRVPADARMPEG